MHRDHTLTRRTRSGDILGPHQQVDVMTALKAMTIRPAYQHFEEKSKGSIEMGKLADPIILGKDPRGLPFSVSGTWRNPACGLHRMFEAAYGPARDGLFLNISRYGNLGRGAGDWL
jgi:hypothetical protein